MATIISTRDQVFAVGVRCLESRINTVVYGVAPGIAAAERAALEYIRSQHGEHFKQPFVHQVDLLGDLAFDGEPW